MIKVHSSKKVQFKGVARVEFFIYSIIGLKPKISKMLCPGLKARAIRN